MNFLKLQALVIPLFILVVSLIFRTINLNYIEFKSDEAINLLLAARPLSGHPIPPGGTVSSIGVLNPPLFTYILMPFTFFTRDPRIISLVIGLINSIAIAALFLVLKRYYGQLVSVISAVLLALSPWAIIYSRKIWTQNLLIPLLVPFLFAVHKIILDKSSRYWWLYSFSSLLLIQLHQASIIFVFSITAFMLFKRVDINWRTLLLGVFLGLIPLFPYFIHEASIGCPDCSSLLTARNRFHPSFDFSILARPFQIVGFGNLNFLIGQDIAVLSERFSFINFLRKGLYIEYIMLPLGILVYFYKFKKIILLPLSLFTMTFIYFILKFESFIHYFIIVIPLLFLFIGVAFDSLLKSKVHLIKYIGIIILISVIVASVSSNVAMWYLVRGKETLGGDYGTPYVASARISNEQLKEFKEQSDYDEIFLSNYIPLEYIYGYLPMGRILYSNVTDKDVINLEDHLKNNSKDPRVKQKLISYYTRSFPSLESLEIIKLKKRDIPQYDFAYQLVLKDYMAKNYKREFISGRLGVSLFYPEHWKTEEAESKIVLTGDNYLLSVVKRNDNIDVICVKGNCNQKNISEIKRSIRPL